MTLAAVPTTERRVSPVVFAELGAGNESGQVRDFDALEGVNAEITVEAGSATVTFRKLLNLREGVVLELDRTPDALVDIRVNGTLVAKGDVVIVDEEIACRIAEIVK